MGRQIRVLHVITDLERGGAEAMLYKLLKYGDRAAFLPEVVSLMEGGPFHSMIESLNIRVHTLGMKKGIPDPRAIPRLSRILSTFAPDILQSWLHHADLLASVTAPLAGRPKLLWNIRCSNLDYIRKSPFHTAVVGALSKLSPRTDGAIVNSRRGRTVHVQMGYRPPMWYLIPNGFDLDEYRPDEVRRAERRSLFRIPANALVIGTISRFHPMKAPEHFLEAIGNLREAGHDCHAIMCGRGFTNDNSALRDMIPASIPESRLHLLGDRDDVSSILNAFDVMVLPSRYGEGFPNAVGEAMASGIPCVVTDVGDSAEIVGDSGLVVSPDDARELTAALCTLAMDSALMASMGRNARERIKTYYSIETAIRGYEDLYKDVAGPEDHTEMPPLQLGGR